MKKLKIYEHVEGLTILHISFRINAIIILQINLYNL